MSVVLADLVVLAIDAAEVAVAEKYVADPVSPRQSRFLAEVGGVCGHYRELARIAARDLAEEAVVAAVVRADRARGEHGAELPGAHAQLAGSMQGDIRGNERHRKKYSKVSM
jgi:hypothetical protein